MSQEMIARHVSSQNRKRSSWRNKMGSNPEISERKAKEVSHFCYEICYEMLFQIEAAAQYFKRRLRILEITSDNSWGMARSTSK